MQFLSTSAEGMNLEHLNDALNQWLDTQYHTTVHSSTRQTPLNRYLKHAHLMREAPKELDDYFRLRVQRKVDKDRTVSLGGRLYEAPVHLIGRVVTLLYHEDDPARVEVFSEGVSQGILVPLDLNVNCRIRRKQHLVELVYPLPQMPGQEPERKYEGGKLFGEREEEEHEL
jgi:hypothetical protein